MAVALGLQNDPLQHAYGEGLAAHPDQEYAADCYEDACYEPDESTSPQHMTSSRRNVRTPTSDKVFGPRQYRGGKATEPSVNPRLKY